MLVGVSLKIALGMFYLRIAIERWHIRVIKSIVVATAIFGFACLFLVIFQCVPGTSIPPSPNSWPHSRISTESCTVSTFWLIYPANENCIPVVAQNGLAFTLNALNACADWTLGTIPFFLVKNLQLSFLTKMLVAGILAFAAV